TTAKTPEAVKCAWGRLMGEPWSRDASGGGHRQRNAYSVGVLFCAFVLISHTAPALAQYIGLPTVFNGPIPTAPAPTGGEPAVGGPAPPWVLTPSLTLGETYPDNVTLAPPGQARSDLITTISPGLNLVGQTAHVN